MAIFENIGYILLFSVGAVAVFLIVLFVIEKKLHKRIIVGRKRRNDFYIEKLSKINSKDSRERLKSIDKIARGFFVEAFKVKNSEYSELEKFFKEKNNKKAVEFSHIMTQLLYSKKEINKKEIQNLVDLLADLISKNHIMSKEEKIELDKKSIILSKRKTKQEKKFLKKFKKQEEKVKVN